MPHLIYYARDSYGVVGSDQLVDVTIYIFDSPSTAERWARIKRRNVVAGILRNRAILRNAAFAHRAADAEVRRTRSVVSAWSAPSDPFGSYSSSFVAHCFTR